MIIVTRSTYHRKSLLCSKTDNFCSKKEKNWKFTVEFSDFVSKLMKNSLIKLFNLTKSTQTMENCKLNYSAMSISLARIALTKKVSLMRILILLIFAQASLMIFMHAGSRPDLKILTVQRRRMKSRQLSTEKKKKKVWPNPSLQKRVRPERG